VTTTWTWSVAIDCAQMRLSSQRSYPVAVGQPNLDQALALRKLRLATAQQADAHTLYSSDFDGPVLKGSILPGRWSDISKEDNEHRTIGSGCRQILMPLGPCEERQNGRERESEDEENTETDRVVVT